MNANVARIRRIKKIIEEMVVQVRSSNHIEIAVLSAGLKRPNSMESVMPVPKNSDSAPNAVINPMAFLVNSVWFSAFLLWSLA